MRKKECDTRVRRHPEAPDIAREYPEIGESEVESGFTMVDKKSET